MAEPTLATAPNRGGYAQGPASDRGPAPMQTSPMPAGQRDYGVKAPVSASVGGGGLFGSDARLWNYAAANWLLGLDKYGTEQTGMYEGQYGWPYRSQYAGLFGYDPQTGDQTLGAKLDAAKYGMDVLNQFKTTTALQRQWEGDAARRNAAAPRGGVGRVRDAGPRPPSTVDVANGIGDFDPVFEFSDQALRAHPLYADFSQGGPPRVGEPQDISNYRAIYERKRQRQAMAPPVMPGPEALLPPPVAIPSAVPSGVNYAHGYTGGRYPSPVVPGLLPVGGYNYANGFGGGRF